MPLTIFAQRMKETREAKGIKRNELAAAVGVTPTTISSYEKSDTEGNGKKPTLENAQAIAEKLGVSLDWLCGMSEKSKKSYADFTIEDYLKNLVGVLMEMTSTVWGDQRENIRINPRARAFVSKIVDLITVYRAGSLSEDLFAVCVDKVIGDCKNLCIFGEALLYDSEALDVELQILNLPERYESERGNYSEGVYTFSDNPSNPFLANKTIEFHLTKNYAEVLNRSCKLTTEEITHADHNSPEE